MRTALIALVALASAVTATPSFAAAQDTSRSDIRCVMVLSLVGRDPKQNAAALQGIYYYLGRLDARGQMANLEGLMKAEGHEIKKEEVQSELNRCGQQLQQSATTLQDTFKRLQAAAQAAQPAAK